MPPPTSTHAAPLIVNEEPGVKLPVKLPKSPPWFLDGVFISSAVTLTQSALGGGVLAYPFCFMSAGVVGGAVLLVAMTSLNTCALFCITYCMAKAREADRSVTDYTSLIHYGCGACVARVLKWIILFFEFGACISFIVLLTDEVKPVLDLTGLHLSRSIVSVLVGLPCALLSSLRSISALKYTAILGVSATFLMVALLISQAAKHPCQEGACFDETGRDGWPKGGVGVTLWPLSAINAVRAMGLVCFAGQMHLQIALVYPDLPPRLALVPHKRNGIAALAGLLLVLIYLPVGVGGFVSFGAATQGDVLTNFADGTKFADAARAGVALAVMASYPMQHKPAVPIFWDRWRACTGSTSAEPTTVFLVVEAWVWTGLTVVLAIAAGSKLAVVFQVRPPQKWRPNPRRRASPLHACLCV